MRGFLLDTCVLSEATRPQPSARVHAWLGAKAPETLFLSVANLAEIRQGIAALADTPKASKLEAWLSDEVLPEFEGRILDVNAPVAMRWGDILGEGRRRGHPHPLMDALLAATARHHDLTLVTRNTADFEAFDIDLINPWQ